jgi:hypothetical protein
MSDGNPFVATALAAKSHKCDWNSSHFRPLFASVYSLIYAITSNIECAKRGHLLFDCLLISRSGLEPDGGADEAEVFADLVGEEALEGEVEFDVAVGEEDEGWWGDGGLGHVVDADAAVHGNGRALEVDLGEEAVHLAGGDALAALAGDQLDLLEEAFDSLLVGGGEEDDGRVVEVLEVVADLLLVDVLVGGLGRLAGAG